MGLQIFDRLSGRARQRRGTPEREAAMRARRARDHLARKREKERQRLARERSRADHAAHRALLRLVLGPAVLGLAIALGFHSTGPLADNLLLGRTPLERIAVQGARTLTPGDVARQAGVNAGTVLAAIDPERVRQAVEAQPWIESARALRLPTGTLLISVVERRAIARFEEDGANDVELVDEHGQRFAGELAPGGPLPLVRGLRVDDEALSVEAREILDALRRHPSLGADPTGLTLILPGAASSEAAAASVGTSATAAASSIAGIPADDSTDPQGHHSGYVLQIGAQGPRALLGRRLLSQRVARLALLLEAEAATLETTRWIDLRYADRAVLQTEPAPG